MQKRSRNSGRRAGSRGQVLVEMAVVMPFFLLVILGGIVDFGMAFHNFVVLQQIADDTARYAAEENGPHGFTTVGPISRYAQTRKPSWWTGTFIVHPPEIIPLETPAESSTPKAVRVTISYCSPTYTPFYHTMFNAVSGFSSIRIQAAAAYKIPRILITR
ncbi:MAG TPA: pilus assembly protein [Candidatus Ozemobacteraceae bacterium]|nr:pilus assembly protein [Candidatus Ozemobacteraceae bacterium]